ncbi:MAG TPA: hypothetical protein P5329_10730 [Candidatus Competibacteraceae bacterium]|nr:hypothetical protein [Candidatus Competibacteraceae bacterium]
MTPECLAGGPLAKVRDGERGALEVRVAESEWAMRQPEPVNLSDDYCLARRYPYIPGHGYSLQRYAVRTLLLNDRYQCRRCRVRTAYLGMQAKQVARL